MHEKKQEKKDSSRRRSEMVLNWFFDSKSNINTLEERNWQSTNVSKRVGWTPFRHEPLFDDRLTLWMKSRSGFVSPRFFHNPSDCTVRRVGGRGASLPPPVIPSSVPRGTCETFHALSFSRLNSIETGHGGISVWNTEIFLSRYARNASV